MAKSLQRSLATRFSLTMFVALLLIALWAYLGMRHTLTEQLDHGLRSASQLEADILAAEWSISRHPGATDLERFIAEVNRFVVVRDRAGHIVASNTELGAGLPLDSASFYRSLGGGWTWATERWAHGGLRSVYLRAPPGSPPDAAVLQVAASLDPLEHDLRAILLLMASTVLLGSAATFVGAGWLARSAVTPVREIAAQAQAITPRPPGRRITAHANVTEFEGLVRVLNDMLGRLEQAAEWHRRIIADLGHDLRTPITAMRAGVEVSLWGERRVDEYRAVLASALEEIDRLARISDALIFLTRLDSGELVPRRARLDARAVVSEAVARARQRMGQHHYRLQRPSDPAWVGADQRLLDMVLDQLIDNAAKHTQPDSTIDVSVSLGDHHVVLVVEDDGPGVADEVLPRLFERFYRADAARGRAGGPGLGLAVSAEIVHLHEGTIAAERGTSGGLRVRIELPGEAGPAL